MPAGCCGRWRGPRRARRSRARCTSCAGRPDSIARAGEPRRPPERSAVFHREFREDLEFWVQTDRRIALRVLRLVETVLRDPFHGLGKPEPLRHLGGGVWSRRLTQEHRVVYLVADDRVDFLQARYHY